MGKYKVELSPLADKHLSLHKKSGNKATLKKIKTILIELSEHPFEGEGKPHPLKHEFSGYWSRSLNQKDRMIYSVDEEKVFVLVVSAIGHYLDK